MKKKYVFAILFGAVGIVLLLGSAHLNIYTDMSKNINIIINNITLSLANIFIFTGAWNALHSTPTTEEILEAAQLPENFQNSGIVKIYETFTEIEWSKYFNKKNKSVIFFFTYASSFTHNNINNLEKMKNKKTIKLIVPDYNNDKLMDSFDQSFRYGKYSENEENPLNDTKSRIIETISTYKGLNAEIYLFPGIIRNTYYFFDDICISAPFNHCKERKYVPAIVSKKGGTWYDFCKMDINDIISQSKKLEGQR